MILCIFKLISSIAKSLNKPFKDNSQGRQKSQSELGIFLFEGFWVVFPFSSFVGNPVYADHCIKVQD